MGGDDSRIYIFHPTKYLEFAATNKRFAPLEAENNQHFYINTLTVMSFLETNLGFTYKEFYFLVFYLGFIFFYLVLKELQKIFGKNSNNKFIPFFLAILYPANPLMGDQIWNNHWVSIFSIPATPLIFYVFIKIIYGNLKFKDILFYNLLITALSVYFGGVIHPMVTFLILGLFLVTFLIFNLKKTFKILSNSLIFLVIFLVTNSYWLYMLASNFKGNQFLVAVQSAAEGDTKNNLDYYGRYFDLTKFIYLTGVNDSSYYDLFFKVSSYLFFGLIIFSVFLIFYKIIKNKNFSYFKSVSPFLTAFFVSLYFQTISLTSTGQRIFLFLCKIFFLLYGLRNYTTKVPPTYTLFALAIILIGYYSIEKYKNISKSIFVIVLILFTSMSIRNLVLLEDYKYNIPKGMERNERFHEDTFELSEYLKANEQIERMTYLPMSTSTWTLTKNGENEVYIGLSPFTVFSGVDDFNGYMYTDFMQGYFKDYKDLIIKAMNEDDLTNYFKHLAYIGTEAIVIDNHLIDTDTTKYMGYDKSIDYSKLNKNIKKSLTLIYTTKSGKYSVYKLPYSVLSFKNNIYRLAQESTSKTFYRFDYSKDIFTIRDLSEKYVNYDVKEININSQINNIDEILYAKSSNSKNIQLTNTEPTLLLNTDLQKVFLLDFSNQDFMRIVLEGNIKDYRIKMAYERDDKSCFSKIFTREDTCEETLKPDFQEIDGKLIITKRFTRYYLEPKKLLIYISSLNPDIKIKDLKPKFYTGLIRVANAAREDLVDVVVTKNQNSYKYQTPKDYKVNKIDRDHINLIIELENDKDSIILNYNKFYNDKWVLSSENIKNQRKFASNIFFNSWIVTPKEGQTTLNINLKFKETKHESTLREVNKYSIIISVVLIMILNIYEYRKIFNRIPFRKLWR